MFKITKMLAVLAAVSAVSATAAMGDATWTGLGATDNWSDMGNWSGDPTAGGNWYLNSLSSTFISICDVHTLNDWGQGHSDKLYLNEHARLYIPTGGYLDRERFQADAGSEIHIDGGTFKADCRPPGHQYIEITDGTWSAARWTYMSSPGVGTLHIVGSDPDQVHLNGFVSWNYNSTPTLQYTLDANGVTPFSIGGEGEFHPHNEPVINGFITIEVAGIDDYLAGAGNVGDVLDLVVCTSGLNYPTGANWTTGLVDDDKGLVAVHATGVTLEILGGGTGPVIPEPSTLVIWGLGLLGLAWYGRRRRNLTNCITNRRSRTMLKHTIMFVAVAGLLLGFAGAAQAVPVTVLNHSFEETVDVNIGGTIYNRVVDIMDVYADGTLDGHLQNAGQPCGAWDPKHWDCSGTNSGDGIGMDSRWPDWWNSNTAGPTDGLNTIIVDNRTTWTNPTENWMRQDIGTVADLSALGSQLTMQFDARYQGSGVDPDGDDYFEAYFEVGGVTDTAGRWVTLFDSTRLVHNYTEIGTVMPLNPIKANPGVSRSVGPQNMETFIATVDLTQYDPGDSVKIIFHNHRERDNGGGSASSRVYLDNVRVDAVSGGGGPVIPEPSTLVIWGLGLLGLAWYGRRRRNLTNCITNRRSSNMLKVSKMLVVVLAATVVLCCVVAARANYGYEWIGDSTVNDEWANPSNWQEVDQPAGIKYPGELDEGYKAFENPYLPGPANPVVVSTVLPHDIEGHCNIGHGAPYSTGGTMKVVGGGEISIGTVGGLWFGRNGRFATLIMEGGKLDTQRDSNGGYNSMNVAQNGGNATNPVKGRIEMTGGEIAVWDLRLANSGETDDALINLHGGQISANNLVFDDLSIQAVIDIQNDGLMLLGGNDTSTVAALAGGSPTTGLIRGSNGVARPDLEALGPFGSFGDLRWVYSSNENQTYVWATGAAEQVIPEPSTLVIWALGLLGLAWYGRRRRNLTNCITNRRSRTMLKHTIMFVAVAGFLFALAPAARAGTVELYAEHFVDSQGQSNPKWETPGGYAGIQINNTDTGWTVKGGGEYSAVVSNAWGDTDPTPDGDAWHFFGFNDSNNAFLYSKPGEATIAAADRVGTQFSADLAHTHANLGVRWMAKVGANYYLTDWELRDPHGAVNSSGAVSDWEQVSLDVEAPNTWYQWTESGGPFDGGWDSYNNNVTDYLSPTAQALPAGDISQLGFYVFIDSNSHKFAADNFVVTAEGGSGGPIIPEPSTFLIWALGLLGLALYARRRRK